MAKQVIVMGVGISNGLWVSSDCLFWYPITSGKQPQTAGSAWTGASAAENAAIQSGSVLEERTSIAMPYNNDASSNESALVQYWTNRNAQIAGRGPTQAQGTYYDPAGGGWVAGPPTEK
jgi:hypothetical protein